MPTPGNDLAIEIIGPAARPLCYIHRGTHEVTETTFLTPPALSLQTGYVVHPVGHDIPAHMHRPRDRTIAGTSEVLLILRGRCTVDIFDDDRRLVTTEELRQGDVMIMTGGGHGFHMLEDTVLFEVKQGPYPGPGEKEQF